MEIKAEYRAIFTEEAREHLEQWEQALLALERAPGDTELIHEIFRCVHTLKGSAGFIGFDDLQRLEHGLESALAEVRDGLAQLSPPLVDILFRGLDLTRRMVNSFAAGTPCDVDVDGLLVELRAAPAEQAAAGDAAAPPAAACVAAAGGSAGPAGPALRYVASVTITAEPRESYLRSLLVRNRVGEVGRVVSEDPSPEALKGATGRFSYRVVLESDCDEPTIRKAFDVDQVELTAFSLESAAAAPQPAPSDSGPPAPTVEPAAHTARLDEVVRVSVERLDTLLNLVGELVIQNSGFCSLTQRLRDSHRRDPLVSELEAKTETLGKITRDLQDGIMKVRMLPVNTVFSRFHRVVRDLSRVRDKGVELQIHGGETEIDKKVMDRLGDPLVHLVRNAVDHGLETREERVARGKGAVGIVRLGAYQDGDHICVEVADDGRGLDRKAILAKGVEKGLVKEEEASLLSDEQVFGLVFLPGFSTAKQVTEVSGRGVGMDVVLREIEALGGSVRIRSKEGEGTTVTLSLPLTMAIVSAVLVEVSDSTFAIPLSSVREVLKVDPAVLRTVGGRKTIRLREEILALVSLEEALGVERNGHGGDGGVRQPVIVVDYDSRKIGLGVERVLGTDEIVIKSLSRHFREVEGLIGASILGSGRIALIVDVEAMVRRYHGIDSAGRASVAPLAPVNEPAPRAGAKTEAPAPAAADAPPAAAAAAAPRQQPVPAAPGPSPTPAPELIGRQAALLEEIHTAGAIQASAALCQLTGQDVRVSFPESRVVELADVAQQLGGDELPMAGIYMGLNGDLHGGMLMMLPAANLAKLHEMLHHTPAGSCASLDDVDMSAIQEAANIVSSSFINAMSDAARLALQGDPPETSVDMCLAVVDSVLARFNQPGDRILLTRAVVFSGRLEEMVCHLLLFLEPQSSSQLVAALQRP